MIATIRHEPAAEAVPWKGGALFLPALAVWPEDAARAVVRELLTWWVWAELNDRSQLRVLVNNLRNPAFLAAAGLGIDRRRAGTEAWLLAYARAHGAAALAAMLDRVGPDARKRFGTVLEKATHPDDSR